LHLLLPAFGLVTDSPNSMPVTRDLSSAKRGAILRWLNSPGPDGNPLLGTAPAAVPDQARPAAAAVTALDDSAAPFHGGKTAAAARRISSRKGNS
jgi:hypothetical protein